jgi:hypothetical protein
MEKQTIEIRNGRGFAPVPNGGVVTFEVLGYSEREEMRNREFQTLYSRYITDNMTMRAGNYTVPLWGEGHNLYPQEVHSIISENKLLPEIIEKQVKFLFGKGPRLYQEKTEGEGIHLKRYRIPVEIPEIEDWLDSWEDNGYDPSWIYLKNRAVDFYNVNTCCSKWHFNNSRRAPKMTGAPKIRALSYVGADEARLATTIDSLTKRIKNSDCKHIILGDWLNPNKYEYEVFHRFNPADPFRYPTAVSFDIDKTFTKWVYTFNNWFKGLLEWIKASNFNPKYLNSYLKNALNAHVHAIIPGSWYNQQRELLQNICNDNLTGSAPVQVEYRGVKLIDEQNRPVPFYETMVEEVIAHELRQITSLMSGEGKNQGKLWASTRWAKDDGWEFEEFPGKFKEYFDTVLSYDRRADQVTLAGKGVPPSISGVNKEGEVSNSGSEVYYNYLIYVNSLTWDEYIVLQDLNRALKYNWPCTVQQKIKFGFWIDIPAKLQDTTPSERLNSTATADTKSNISKTQEQS